MFDNTILITIALIIGAYLSWNIGANDVANAIGTAVGTKALTLKKAIIIAAIFEFSGAFFFGESVSDRLQTGIINVDFNIINKTDWALALISAILASALWLQLASHLGWPVSTTHSIVGALIGVGIVVCGISSINLVSLAETVIAWILSPIMGGIIGFLSFNLLKKKIFYSSSPIKKAKKLVPKIIAGMIFIQTYILLFNKFSSVKKEFIIFISIIISIISVFITKHFIKKINGIPINHEEFDPEASLSLQKALKHIKKAKDKISPELKTYSSMISFEIKHLIERLDASQQNVIIAKEQTIVEKIFSKMQIVSICFMALAHGSNDIANSIGPLSGIVSILNYESVIGNTKNLLLFGGLGVVIGLTTWGWRVIETIGKKLTRLTPSRGFSAELGTAITVISASKFGLPVSTTHTIVGAVIGVGLAKGIGAINLSAAKNIALSWLITVPAGIISSSSIYFLIKFLIHQTNYLPI